MVGWQTIAAGIGLSTLIGAAYRNEMRQLAIHQLAESRIALTSQGIIEYAVTGEGEAVLISHSASGGYDQGLATARRFAGFKVIAPSRAGYLRTPVTTGLTPRAMASAYGGLLDTLKINRTVVVGWSAGAMSALEFALQYPDRCRALILGGAVTQPPPNYVLDIFASLVLSNQSDFLNWMVSKIAANVVIPLMEHDPDTQKILSAFATANPASKRLPGFKLDVEHMRRFHPLLETITVPTLMIHGTHDMLVPIAHAQAAVKKIPGAHLLIIPGGQHDCPIRYPDQVSPAIDRFLNGV